MPAGMPATGRFTGHLKRRVLICLLQTPPRVAVSIVVPVRNEAGNVAPLIAEIAAALDGRWVYEIIYVNDGSTDATAERLAAVMTAARKSAPDPPRDIVGPVGGGAQRGPRRGAAPSWRRSMATARTIRRSCRI